MRDKSSFGFDFGENWTKFSESSLNLEGIKRARRDFNRLISHTGLKNGNFLDIGFGQGLSLMFALESGFTTIGLDINEKNLKAVKLTKEYFSDLSVPPERLLIGSILKDEVVEQLFARSPNGFDIVHSWGVLHHTGNLNRAFSNAAKLVSPDGYLVVAIYKRHWTSPLWKKIKILYCVSPRLIRMFLVSAFFPLILLRVLTQRELRSSINRRGMEFFVDLKDWIGGYPYEYENAGTLTEWASKCGFETTKIVEGAGWTGCNEYVFKRSKNSLVV